MATVYLITNTFDGKMYVGITKRPLHTRWYYHKYWALNSLGYSYLHRAIRKYGPESFTIEEVYQHPDEEFILKVAERHFIEEYGTHVSMGKGYNMTWGGEGSNGYKHDEKTKEKMRANHAPMYGENNPLFGVGHTEKSKDKMSIASSRRYHISTPEGNEFCVYGLSRFCKNEGLNHSAMYKVVKGSQLSHKGYKAKVVC